MEKRRSGWVETARDAVVRRTPSHYNKSLINDINLMYKGQQRLPAVNHLLCWCLNVYGGLEKFNCWMVGSTGALRGSSCCCPTA